MVVVGGGGAAESDLARAQVAAARIPTSDRFHQREAGGRRGERRRLQTREKRVKTCQATSLRERLLQRGRSEGRTDAAAEEAFLASYALIEVNPESNLELIQIGTSLSLRADGKQFVNYNNKQKNSLHNLVE